MTWVLKMTIKPVVENGVGIKTDILFRRVPSLFEVDGVLVEYYLLYLITPANICNTNNLEKILL